MEKENIIWFNHISEAKYRSQIHTAFVLHVVCAQKYIGSQRAWLLVWQ